jgi:general secretion pathway protein C
MQTNAFQTWSIRAATFALAALAALSAVFWTLKGTQSHSVSTATAIMAPGLAPLDPKSVARALGGGATTASNMAGAGPASSGRAPYLLVGVLASGAGSVGAALISVDGKPAKPFRVGTAVDGNLVLQSVAARRAMLGPAMNTPAQITLELPPLNK